MKSSLDEIRARFDKDGERFSNMETGQTATMDAVLCMTLITDAAARVTPHARTLLDIGCGAGNYTLKMLGKISPLHCTLIDLSLPMLQRAAQRIGTQTTGGIELLQGDMRTIDLGENRFDIVLAASTLHHLREETQWMEMFGHVFRALRPGGSFWIFDYISHEPTIEPLMRDRHGQYLAGLKGGGSAGDAYRDHVFAYIEQEDTPRPLLWQIDHLRAIGFTHAEILHKNASFAAFGAVKV